MAGGKSYELSVELHSISRPFYKAGDTVSGRVNLTVATSRLSVKDIHVALLCEEFSAVAQNDEYKQAMMEESEARHVRRLAKRKLKGKPPSGKLDSFTSSKPSALTSHQTHIELTSDLLVPSSREGSKQAIERGPHSFEFSIVLPDSVNMLPPHSPVPTRNGLKIGVIWAVKAVVQRVGHLKRDIRAEAELPVHPTPINTGLADLTGRSELSGQRSLAEPKKPSTLAALFSKTDSPSEKLSQQKLTVRLGYPEAGIPQGLLEPNFALSLAASNGPVTVIRIQVYLVQRCLACVRRNLICRDTYKNRLSLGRVDTRLEVGSETTDLSNLVAAFGTQDVVARPFSSELVTVSYDLRLEVECESGKGKLPDIVALEVPVNVIGPGACWRSDDDTLGVRDEKDSRQSQSGLLRSADATAANYGSLPSYEETLPVTSMSQNTYNDTKQ